MTECCGFIQKDLDHGYVLTGRYESSAYTDKYIMRFYRGTIHELTGDRKSGSWTWGEYASFDGFPKFFLYQPEDNSIYVATTQGIYLITDGGHVQTIVDSDVSGAIRANSMVIFDGSIYCGSPAGIYRYDMEQNREAWYPMDYASHVETEYKSRKSQTVSPPAE